MKSKIKGKFKYKIFLNGEFQEVESTSPTYLEFIEEVSANSIAALVDEETQNEETRHRAVIAVSAKWRISIPSIYRRIYGIITDKTFFRS